MITEEDIKVALEFRSRFARDSERVKPVWHLDCFRHRTSPEDCDPRGCWQCEHWKRLNEEYGNT